MAVSLWRTVKIFLVFRMQKNVTSFSFNNVDKVWIDQIIQNIFSLYYVEQEQTLVLPLLAFIVPFMTFATPTEDEWRGWVRLWTLELQIPHVLFVRGPWLQGLEKALITGWVLPCELKAALHSLNTCKQLQKKEDMSVEKSNISGIKKEKWQKTH